MVQEILGVERRRKWDDETKAAIVVESFRSEYSVSFVARRHGVSASQLFAWRKAAREKMGDEAEVATSFLPVEVDGGAAPQVTHAAAPTLNSAPDRLEIVFANGRRLFVAGDIDPKRLSRLVGAIDG